MSEWNKNNNYVRKWYGKVLHIFEPVYRTNFYYIKAKTEAEYSKIFYKRFNIQDEPKDRSGRFNVISQQREEVGVIWADDIPNLAHEALHAVFWLAERRGLEVHFKSEEAFCYLHTFLMRAILNI